MYQKVDRKIKCPEHAKFEETAGTIEEKKSCKEALKGTKAQRAPFQHQVNPIENEIQEEGTIEGQKLPKEALKVTKVQQDPLQQQVDLLEIGENGTIEESKWPQEALKVKKIQQARLQNQKNPLQIKETVTIEMQNLHQEALKETKINPIVSQPQVDPSENEENIQLNSGQENTVPPWIEKVNLKDDCFLQKRIYCRQCNQDNEQLIDYETVLRFLEKEYLKSNIIDTSLLSLKLNLENLRKAIIFQFDYMMKIIDQIGSEKRQIQINENLLKDLLTDPRDNYRSIHNLLQDVSRKVIIDKDKNISLTKEYYNKFEFDILTNLKKCCKIYEDTIAFVTVNTHISPPVFELRPVRIPNVSLMKEFKIEQYTYQYQPKIPDFKYQDLKNNEINLDSKKTVNSIALNCSSDILFFSAFQDSKHCLKFKKIKGDQCNSIDCNEQQCDKIEFFQDNSFFCLQNQVLKFYQYNLQGQKWNQEDFDVKQVNCYTFYKQNQSIQVATGCGMEIVIWEILLNNNEKAQKLVAFSSQSEITCLQFNKQAPLLIAGCLDGVLIIYENCEGFWKFKKLIKKHSSPIKYLSFTSQNYIISATFNQIFVWPNLLYQDLYLFAYEIEKKPHHLIEYSKSHLLIGYSNQTAIFRLEGNLMILEHTFDQKYRLAQLNENNLAISDKEQIEIFELKN